MKNLILRSCDWRYQNEDDRKVFRKLHLRLKRTALATIHWQHYQCYFWLYLCCTDVGCLPWSADDEHKRGATKKLPSRWWRILNFIIILPKFRVSSPSWVSFQLLIDHRCASFNLDHRPIFNLQNNWRYSLPSSAIFLFTSRQSTFYIKIANFSHKNNSKSYVLRTQSSIQPLPILMTRHQIQHTSQLFLF